MFEYVFGSKLGGVSAFRVVSISIDDTLGSFSRYAVSVSIAFACVAKQAPSMKLFNKFNPPRSLQNVPCLVMPQDGPT